MAEQMETALMEMDSTEIVKIIEVEDDDGGDIIDQLMDQEIKDIYDCLMPEDCILQLTKWYRT